MFLKNKETLYNFSLFVKMIIKIYFEKKRKYI